MPWQASKYWRREVRYALIRFKIEGGASRSRSSIHDTSNNRPGTNSSFHEREARYYIDIKQIEMIPACPPRLNLFLVPSFSRINREDIWKSVYQLLLGFRVTWKNLWRGRGILDGTKRRIYIFIERLARLATPLKDISDNLDNIGFIGSSYYKALRRIDLRESKTRQFFISN